MNDCKKCGGSGLVTYREVLNASGPDYDQDLSYELRTVTCSCLIEFTQWLHESGYRNIRLLPNQRWTGTKGMLFTTGIVVGDLFDRYAVHGRYCYHSEEAAVAALVKWEGVGDPEGYVAKKGF